MVPKKYLPVWFVVLFGLFQLSQYLAVPDVVAVSILPFLAMVMYWLAEGIADRNFITVRSMVGEITYMFFGWWFLKAILALAGNVLALGPALMKLATAFTYSVSFVELVIAGSLIALLFLKLTVRLLAHLFGTSESNVKFQSIMLGFAMDLSVIAVFASVLFGDPAELVLFYLAISAFAVYFFFFVYTGCGLLEDKLSPFLIVSLLVGMVILRLELSLLVSSTAQLVAIAAFCSVSFLLIFMTITLIRRDSVRAESEVHLVITREGKPNERENLHSQSKL